jgi:polyhydroxybutyrate depolymerase
VQRALFLLALLAVAACGGGGRSRVEDTTPRGTSPAPARPAVTDACATAPQPGTREVAVGARSVIVRVGRAANAHAPLVLGLHGAGQPARDVGSSSGLDRAADRHGVVVAYPQTTHRDGFWRYPDRSGADPVLLRSTIAAVQQALCTDPSRTFITGVSNGGRMAYGAGCQLSDVVLGIAPVSGGTRSLPPCRAERAVSALVVHGTADRVVPYAGTPNGGAPVRSVVAGLAQRAGCSPRPVTTRPTRFVTRLRWRGCRDDLRVEHLRVSGAGHGWPPSAGPRGVRLDGAEAVVRFFLGLRARPRANAS